MNNAWKLSEDNSKESICVLTICSEQLSNYFLYDLYRGEKIWSSTSTVGWLLSKSFLPLGSQLPILKIKIAVLYNPFNSLSLCPLPFAPLSLFLSAYVCVREKERETRTHTHPNSMYQAASSFLFLQNQYPFVIKRNKSEGVANTEIWFLNVVSITLFPRIMPDDPVQSHLYHPTLGGPHPTYSALHFL